MNSKQLISILERGIIVRSARLGGPDHEEILDQIAGLRIAIAALIEQGEFYDRTNCTSGQKASA
jgi:hypothetical protein